MTTPILLVTDALAHQLVAAAYVLRDERVPQEYGEELARSLAIVRKMLELKDRVIGNRKGDSIVTWEDARLYFLSAMEEAKVVLESPKEEYSQWIS